MEKLKIITLDRRDATEFSPSGTEGVLMDGDKKICDTLELHEENNKPRESHIPTGNYICRIIMSPSKGRVYHICDVPGRGNVLIHSANFAGDTDAGLKSELLGCVALGSGFGVLNKQRAILQSKVAVKMFMDMMGGKDFVLKVIN